MSPDNWWAMTGQPHHDSPLRPMVVKDAPMRQIRESAAIGVRLCSRPRQIPRPPCRQVFGGEKQNTDGRRSPPMAADTDRGRPRQRKIPQWRRHLCRRFGGAEIERTKGRRGGCRAVQHRCRRCAHDVRSGEQSRFQITDLPRLRIPTKSPTELGHNQSDSPRPDVSADRREGYPDAPQGP